MSTANLICCACGDSRQTKITNRGNARLPKGWRRHDEHVLCPKCWQERFVIRTVTFPVSGAVGADWEELRHALSECWQQTTALANWAVNELAKADCVRLPGMDRLPPMRPVYLYPEARRRFPGLASQSISSILQTVERRYRASRLDVVWWANSSLPSYRYPVPYSVCNQGWKAHHGPDAQPLIDVALGDRRCTLILRRGPGYHRQLRSFARLVNGESIQGTVALYRQLASNGDHRSGMIEREPGGGRRTHYRVMAKLTIWLPRGQLENASGTMRLRTTSTSFWIAEFDDQAAPWILNADHVRRWSAEHRKRIQRLAEDTKHEYQLPKRARYKIADYRGVFVEKHRRRITTWCHQATAMLVKLAECRRVAQVEYDDRDQTYLSEFPWSRLEECLAAKLEERGIELSSRSKSEQQKQAA